MGVCISNPVARNGGQVDANGARRVSNETKDTPTTPPGTGGYHGADTQASANLNGGTAEFESNDAIGPFGSPNDFRHPRQVAEGPPQVVVGGHQHEEDLNDGYPSEEGAYDDEPLRPGKEFVETMAEFEVGETIGDKYEVMEVLPCGTVGRTYRARSRTHDAQCVFKVLCFVSREPLVESVREDQKVLTRLQHANVLPVYDVMEDPNHENMIVVTAYIPNRDITRHAGLLAHHGLDQLERLRMMLRDIGVGIRVLHSHHVYHHNIKLENILETKDGGCCIADAGYNKLFSTLTVEQLISLNNPGLLPPEVFTADIAAASGSPTSPELSVAKIDVWSFGMCMYRLAFGTFPYEIDSQQKSVEEIRKTVVSHRLKEPIKDCPADLWEVIKWSLEKKCNDRPNIMKLLRHPFFRIATGQSFAEAGNSASFFAAGNSVMNVHRSLTDQHTGFVISVVLGKGPHSENFLVHLPSLPGKVFVLKALNGSLRKRLASETTTAELDMMKKLAMSRKVRHRNLAHFYEIVDNGVSTYATQRFFPRGNLAINYPPLDREGLCVSLMLADVLRGLICLHDLGLYHLNLKLSNIYYADEECFVVADFGPVVVTEEDIFTVDHQTDNLIFHVGVPEHVQTAIREKGPDALQYIDTFCVGLIASSVLPDVRLMVWDQYYGNTADAGAVVDVERIIGRLALRQQQQKHLFPPHFFDFVTTALTTCKTARELLQHPFVVGECKPDDLRMLYFDVHDDDIKQSIRDKFVCRDENRLADLLGHGGFLLESPAAHTLGRCVSTASMERRASQNNGGGSCAEPDTLSVSMQGAISPPGDDKRISYAYMEKLTCGLCRKELKLVIYRCPECSDYIRCGKCASVDNHNHHLDPWVIESVCHADADDEDMMVAILMPPSAINKHALEELEMQADLPTGTLVRAHHPNTRSFRKSKDAGQAALSRVPSITMNEKANGTQPPVSPASQSREGNAPDDDDDGVSVGGGDGGQELGSNSNKKRLLMEHEAMEDTNPVTEIELCRNNMERELMLHNFSLTEVPPEMFDPPLAHIIHLNLSNNLLVALPHDLSFLHSLQKLSLANNKLAVLPDSIGDLTELQYLDVSHNELQDLPQSLMFADKLDTIAMDYNNCNEIPGVILDMPQLRVIYLAENRRISKWPPVQQLQQLGPIKFGLDNEPLLWKEYLQIKDQMSRVTVMWNKIYPDEIIANLYCGSLRSAQSLAVYDRLKITYVLTVGRGLEPTVIEGMCHQTVIVDDIEGAIIDHSFDTAVDFIDEALQKGTGCLVHCFAGMSRSATTVIAYLMKRKSMRLDEAYCVTRRGRPAIYPNAGFFGQLLALDKALFPGQRPLDMACMERHIIPSA